jgi:hypothetical protein
MAFEIISEVIASVAGTNTAPLYRERGFARLEPSGVYCPL